MFLTLCPDSNRDYVAMKCYEPFNHPHSPSDHTSIHHRDDDEGITFAQIRDSLFPSSVNSRWATSAEVQEPDCVSFQDHGLGTAAIDNIRIVNDLPEDVETLDDYHRMIDQDVDFDQENVGLFEYSEADPTVIKDTVEVTLKARHLSRRERSKHHHHTQQKQPNEKRNFDPVAPQEKDPADVVKIVAEQIAPLVAIRADSSPGQSVYTLNNQGDATSAADVLFHESLRHSESSTAEESVAQAAGRGEGQQTVLIQGGTGALSPETASESLGQANAGHPVDTDGTESATAAEEGESHPKKGTVLLAAVPILLLMGAIAGFTVYRRYHENNLDQGNRNDARDDLSGDGYHRRGKRTAKDLLIA